MESLCVALSRGTRSRAIFQPRVTYSRSFIRSIWLPRGESG